MVNLVLVAHKTEMNSNELFTFPLETNELPLDPLLYCDHFLQVPTETFKDTFKATTQLVMSRWIA